MSERGPDFDELVGDVDPDERDRLRAVHELLVEAGPPPELPPDLAVAPKPARPAVIRFPRRYRVTAAMAAAAIAVMAFGIGYVTGRGTGSSEAFTVLMSGPGGARAELVVLDQDAAGNWPMELRVRGLAPPPRGKLYELWLTRKGRLTEPCGSFTVAGNETEATLNAPYRLKAYDGWVVVVEGSEEPVLRTSTV